jgi:RHS repeat-associated protein
LSGSTKDWVFLHQGGERIAAGDYEFRNRVYSPTLGRWLSNDPLGFEAGDVNTYRHVGNSPGNGLDPSGLEQGYWFDYIVAVPPICRLGSEWFRSRDLDQRLGDLKEKQLNKEYILDKVMKAPVGNGTAGEGRNNTFDPNFNVNQQQAKGDIRVGGQIIKAQWDYLPSIGPVFTRQMLSKSKIIAEGPRIDKVDKLVERFGGIPGNWKKKKGTDSNGREWHWYEYKGKRYGEKPAGDPDPF